MSNKLLTCYFCADEKLKGAFEINDRKVDICLKCVSTRALLSPKGVPSREAIEIYEREVLKAKSGRYAY